MNANVRYSATIFKRSDGTYDIIVRAGDPLPPDGAELIDVLYRKDGESLKDFRERAIRFTKEECP